MLTLWNESLWGDEGFSAMAVMKPFMETMGVVLRDTAPPGFYVIGWLWGQVFGYSEVALRSLSLLLMLGASWFAGLIVKEVSKDKWLGWLVGVLAFLSPFSFRYGFEWRMYALLTFATLGSIYFFVARKWKGYVVLTTLALYTHHLALFTVVGQGLWFLWTEFSSRGSLNWGKLVRIIKHLWPFWLVVLLYVPWLYPMYLQTTRVQGAGFWLKAPTLAEAGDLVYRFFVGGVRQEWRLWVAGLAGVLLGFKDWKKVGKKWLEVFLLVMSPVVWSFVVSHLVTPIFYDRYLLSVVLGMAVLIGMGVKRWGKVILVVMIMVYGFSSYQLFINPSKRDFRGFSEIVKEELKEGDKLVNYNGRAHHIWETQYYGIGGPIYAKSGELPLWVGTAQMKQGDIISQLPEADRIGLITSEDEDEVELPEEWEINKITYFGDLRALWLVKE